jgi:hypothetical protein
MSARQGRGADALSRPSPVRLLAPLFLAGILSLAVMAPAAQAATRAEFVAQAEALCKTSNQAVSARSRHLFRKYKRLRPKGRFSKLTKRQKRRDDALYYGGFARTLIFEGSAMHALDGQLQLLPKAPGDEPVIAQWIDSRRVDADLIRDTGRRLRRVSRHKPRRALNVVFSLDLVDDQLGLTDLTVGSYGFDQCLLANSDF